MKLKLETINFNNLLHWQQENHLHAFKTFLQNAELILQKKYKIKKIYHNENITTQTMQKIAKLALQQQQNINKQKAKLFFEKNFIPKKIKTKGFLTAYYQPKIFGSLKKTKKFSYPLYRPPKDLQKNKCYKYDRRAIQQGALKNKNLELLYVENAIEAFFIHVQGSANIILPNNKIYPIQFAAKTGHKYNSLGKILCKKIGKDPQTMTANFLRNWLYKNINIIDEFLALNRSYIFFQHSPIIIGAAKVPLVAKRSLAIDKKLHTFATPIWLMTEKQNLIKTPRLMIAQDIGSAIVGVARGDIFIGQGKNAALLAGKIRHNCQFVIFVPKVKP